MPLFLPSRGTAFDLRFSLFSIPVTVSPFFWVLSALLGFSWLRTEPGGPANLIAWVLCVFVSILIHEFGHALTMRAFGHWPEVVLFHFGGYATFRGQETAGRDLLISAAGPAIQLVLFAAMTIGAGLWFGLGANSLLLLTPGHILTIPGDVAATFVATGAYEKNTPLYAITVSLLEINLIWPLFNMLPVLPLDGGRMLSSTLELLRVRKAQEWALRVGVGIAVVAAVFFLLIFHSIYLGMMFAFLAMSNYQSLHGERMEGM